MNDQRLNVDTYRMIIIVISISIYKHPHDGMQRGESSKFVCNQRLDLLAPESLPCLRICEGLPVPSLLDNVKCTNISRA